MLNHKGDFMLRRTMVTVLFFTGWSVLLPGVRGETQLPAGDKASSSFEVADFKKHVEFLASDELAGRAPGTPGSEKALQYILEQFKACQLQPVLEHSQWVQEFPLTSPDQNTGSLFAKNAIAIYPGRGKLRDEAVLVCAHYDHIGVRSRPGPGGEDLIYNGADDNASGVAAILMMAKALTDQPVKERESARAVLFAAFDAEEQGLARRRALRTPATLALGKNRRRDQLSMRLGSCATESFSPAMSKPIQSWLLQYAMSQSNSVWWQKPVWEVMGEVIMLSSRG